MHNRHGHATITSLSIIVLSLLLLGMLPHRLGDNAALAATRADALGARLNAGVAWESEAEDGTVAYPMIVWEDPEASGGKFVYCARGWSEGMVTFTVNIETAATYYLWARVKGEGWTKNSFYVHMDDGDPIEYEIPQFGGDWVWGWDLVRPVDRAPVAFALEAGEHTLSFQVREPNAKLDRLLLTDDPTYLPEGASTPLYIWRQEAETGTLSDAMNRGEDIGASACEYVSSSSGFSNAKVTIKFDVVVPGDYYVWVRTRGQDYQHNSFFVSVDESSEFHYEVPQFKEAWDWGWDIVHPDKQEVQPVALDTGKHTVQFRARESDTWLDVVLITNDASYVPGVVTSCQMTPTPTSTLESTLTPTPTDTVEPTLTATPTETPEPSPTPTETTEPSATPTEEATATVTLTPTVFVQPEGVLWLPIIMR